MFPLKKSIEFSSPLPSMTILVSGPNENFPFNPENLTDTGCGIIFIWATEAKPHNRSPKSRRLVVLFWI
jgi:hypothetical protein